MPIPNWLKILARRRPYIVPKTELQSATQSSVAKSLLEAQKYKQSQNYLDLVRRTASNAEAIGTPFQTTLFFGIERPFPQIIFKDRPIGDLGSYVYGSNILQLDPKQLIGVEHITAPFHEGLHWQRVGAPDLATPKYQKWVDAIGLQKPQSELDALWHDFFSDPHERYTLKIRENMDDYLVKRVKSVLFDKAHNYLTKRGELQANGLEAGKAIGLTEFEPYPGYNTAKDAIRASKQYNSYLKDIKSNTEKETQDFWKILTGNFLPATMGAVTVGSWMNKNK